MFSVDILTSNTQNTGLSLTHKPGYCFVIQTKYIFVIS
jgi:hypothetical protein